VKRTSVVGCGLVASLAFLGGCGGSQATQPNTQSYIKTALQSSAGRALGLSQLFPTNPATASCVIRGGGPAPGIRVPGTCSTSVRDGSRATVTVKFVESWAAHRFRGPGAGLRVHLSHTYELMLSTYGAGSSKVLRSWNYGDFPPQLVR